MNKAEQVERYFAEEHDFKAGIAKLRELSLKTTLEETYKWQFPTYTLNGKNVVAICKFKKHFGLWFFNGVFLNDALQVLENAQEGKTQAMRHWKFYANDAIKETEVLAYIHEAIENQEQGRVLKPQKKKAEKRIVPKLLKDALQENATVANAFKKLSLYNQNEYAEYIDTAKQEKTKLKRLEKILPMIEAGKGLNDLYRK